MLSGGVRDTIALGRAKATHAFAASPRRCEKIRVQNVGSFNPRPSSARPHDAAAWSGIMGILYRAGWKGPCQDAKAPCLPPATAEPSGICLLLALAVIAAIVGLLGHAARDIQDARAVASTTVQSHLGGLK